MKVLMVLAVVAIFAVVGGYLVSRAQRPKGLKSAEKAELNELRGLKDRLQEHAAEAGLGDSTLAMIVLDEIRSHNKAVRELD